MLVVGVLAVVLPAGSATATGAGLPALIVQRQQLQAEYLKLMGTKRDDLGRLLAVQDQVKGIRRHLDANAQTLSDLGHHQADLQASIATLRARREADMVTAAAIARGQYKSMEQNRMTQIMFSSTNLGQVVNRMLAAEAVAKRAHEIASALHDEERGLVAQAAALHDAQLQAAKVQDRLNVERSQLQAAAADYQQRLGGLDAASRDLLKRIDAVDAAIVAAAGGGPNGRVYYSRAQVIQIIDTAAARYGANPSQLERVASCESSFNPYAYDRASGASGLFQFMPGTFYGHGGHDIWSPYEQSNIAAQMFAQGYSYEWTCR